MSYIFAAVAAPTGGVFKVFANSPAKFGRVNGVAARSSHVSRHQKGGYKGKCVVGGLGFEAFSFPGRSSTTFGVLTCSYTSLHASHNPFVRCFLPKSRPTPLYFPSSPPSMHAQHSSHHPITMT